MALRIGIDATQIGSILGEKGGMRNTLQNLLTAIREVDRTNSYILLCNFFRSSHKTEYERLRLHFSAAPNFSFRLSRIPNRLMQTIPVPIGLIAGPVDLFHFPFQEAYPVWSTRTIATIHDLRALCVNDDFEASWGRLLEQEPDRLKEYQWLVRYYERQRLRLPRVIRNADFIITPSQYVRDRVCERLGIAADRVRAIPWAVAPVFRPTIDSADRRQRLLERGIDGRFLLAVGRLDPQKNLLRLIEAFAMLLRETRTDLKLVIAGSSTWFGPILRAQIRAHNLQNEVILTGYVPDEDLCHLYGGAEALVFPSLFEGFGIPPLEAMACGCPVLASTATSIPEVVGDAALLVDPYSAEDLAQGMNAIVSDFPLRSTLRERGYARVARFNWETTARQTIAVYADAAGMR